MYRITDWKVDMPPESDEKELDPSLQELDGETRITEKLYRYARGGNWTQANTEIFKSRPKNSKYLTATISDNRDIALHVAVAENHPKFAEELVKYMTKEDLAIKNGEVNTAFFLVAESGIHINLARKMYEKNTELPSIRGKGERFPIYVAAYHGHKEMTEFLREKVGSLEERDINELLKHKTFSEFFEDFKSLRRLVLRDDWDKAYGGFLKENKMYSIATISDRGNTALHVAVIANSSKFVRRLVEYMQKEDLAIKNRDGNTAFYLAALSGRVELAKLMFKKNDELPKIRGSNKKKMLPILAAAEQDHKQMVEFLYTVSKKHLEEDDIYPLLCSLLRMSDLFDVALNLIKKHFSVLDKRSYEALEVLAGTPMMSRDFANQNQEGFFKRYFKLFKLLFPLADSGSDKLPHEKLPQRTLELLKLLLERVDSRKLIEVAAKKENVELLSIIICDYYPELVLEREEKSFRLLIHNAILKRQEGILKLINKMKTLFENALPSTDILNLAGELPPSYLLDNIPGVALQMQYELWWFKEVRKIVNTSDAQAKNDDGKTPIALFNEKHRDLKEKGEKWMKDTANSCMIVAALIATVVFASAFTVPGGSKDGSGTPHFLHKVSFTVFVISDAVSLVSSICSILTFLSILTSRYAEEDFLLALPTKLIVGLSTLLLSIVAMMVVFCTTIFIVFEDGNIWVPIFVTVISSLPAILFTEQQRKLLIDVLVSTNKIKCLSNEEGRARELNKFSEDNDDDDDDEGRYQHYKNRMQKCLRTFYQYCLRR
ncbi:ankyrin repeat-containing protein ITN1-like isoform X3 [Pistacia vera]|uniref:ankyrin repeat-containing protein ITN1-like isoform X3 n=1 Tax=Pistacia vera TaxID=55513 RepID=UPI0012632A4C|nr:ankyrin repeat-containing protein ITN1-like isoform X3 [Pistacia vera]